MATFTMKFKNWEGIKTMVDNMTMDKQQAARDICPECGELGHTSCYNAGYQAAQAALMPVLVEARDAIIEARRNIDEVDNAFHVYPINDFKEHFTDGRLCWCGPKSERGLVVHNSMDGREKYETGERKPS